MEINPEVAFKLVAYNVPTLNKPEIVTLLANNELTFKLETDKVEINPEVAFKLVAYNVPTFNVPVTVNEFTATLENVQFPDWSTELNSLLNML